MSLAAPPQHRMATPVGPGGAPVPLPPGVPAQGPPAQTPPNVGQQRRPVPQDHRVNKAAAAGANGDGSCSDSLSLCPFHLRITVPLQTWNPRALFAAACERHWKQVGFRARLACLHSSPQPYCSHARAEVPWLTRNRFQPLLTGSTKQHLDRFLTVGLVGWVMCAMEQAARRRWRSCCGTRRTWR